MLSLSRKILTIDTKLLNIWKILKLCFIRKDVIIGTKAFFYQKYLNKLYQSFFLIFKKKNDKTDEMSRFAIQTLLAPNLASILSWFIKTFYSLCEIFSLKNISRKKLTQSIYKKYYLTVWRNTRIHFFVEFQLSSIGNFEIYSIFYLFWSTWQKSKSKLIMKWYKTFFY